MALAQDPSDVLLSLDERVVDLSTIDDEHKRARLEERRMAMRKELSFDRYDRQGRHWYQRAYLEAFLFMYDTRFYNPVSKEYQIDSILDDGEAQFGGYDYIVLWQSYPRMGFDQRNLFDFYREMPGGLKAIRGIRDRARERGVRVFLNYMPWDKSTRRRGKSDAEEFAEIVQAVGADGAFLDTMSAIDASFADAVRGCRPRRLRGS